MNVVDKIIKKYSSIGLEPERLFHGRGGRYPGFEFLNVDWLNPVLLITLYEDQGRESEKALLTSFKEQLPDNVESIVIQRRYRKPAVFETLFGKPVSRYSIKEQGLQYQLDFQAGMHTGLFLDMAETRKWVRENAAGKRVLNLFSYTCAFSVAAVEGQADKVVNVDLSRLSLNRGRESHRLNGHDLSNVSFLGHDIFKSWGKLRRLGPFDLIIVDPPSFQRGSFVLAKDYPRVIRQLSGLVAPAGDVLACLNDPGEKPEYLIEQFKEFSPGIVFKKRLINPDAFKDVNEQRSLKVMHFKCAGDNFTR